MGFPALAKLLILQDRDQRFRQLETSLKQWPLEKAKAEGEIAKEKARVAEAEAVIKELEVKRLSIEGDVSAAEDKVVKHRTQQLQIKKQDEYDALELEIKTLLELIDAKETEELGLLEEIGKSEAVLAGLKAEMEKATVTFEAQIAIINQSIATNEAELDEARAAVEKARGEVSDAAALQQYDFVVRQVKGRFPIIVTVSGAKCSGCHLKVESEVESEARRGQQLIRCSNCGRIVYFDG